MRVYIAGPMTGVPYFNRPLFDEVADWLKAQGFEVKNPCDMDWNAETDARFADPLGRPLRARKHYLAHDIPVLMSCDAIVMLPSWRSSVGAALEHYVAEVFELAIGEWDPREKTVWWTRLDAKVVKEYV